jgi:hypothetical protein
MTFTSICPLLLFTLLNFECGIGMIYDVNLTMNIMNLSSMPIGGDENSCAQAVWHMLLDASTLADRLLDCTVRHTAVDCAHWLIDVRLPYVRNTGRTLCARTMHVAQTSHRCGRCTWSTLGRVRRTHYCVRRIFSPTVGHVRA